MGRVVARGRRRGDRRARARLPGVPAGRRPAWRRADGAVAVQRPRRVPARLRGRGRVARACGADPGRSSAGAGARLAGGDAGVRAAERRPGGRPGARHPRARVRPALRARVARDARARDRGPGAGCGGGGRRGHASPRRGRHGGARRGVRGPLVRRLDLLLPDLRVRERARLRARGAMVRAGRAVRRAHADPLPAWRLPRPLRRGADVARAAGGGGCGAHRSGAGAERDAAVLGGWRPWCVWATCAGARAARTRRGNCTSGSRATRSRPSGWRSWRSTPGTAARAGELAARALRQLPGECRAGRAPALDVLARARAAVGDVDGARAAAVELRSIAAQIGTAPLLGAASHAEGVAAAAAGDADAARRSFEDAAALFRDAGGPVDEGRARLALAGVLAGLGRGDAARHEATAALDAFAAAGANAYAPAALERLGHDGVAVDRARAGGPAAGRGRLRKPRDRGRADDQRAHRPPPRREHLREARLLDAGGRGGRGGAPRACSDWPRRAMRAAVGRWPVRAIYAPSVAASGWGT